MKKIVAGILLGALVVMAVPTMAQGKKSDHRKAEMQEMIKELGLDDAQAAKMKMILKEQREVKKQNKLSKEEMSKLSEADQKIEKAKMKLKKAEAAKAMEEKLQTVLTVEQMQNYKAIRKQQKARKKDMRNEQIHENKSEAGDIHQVEPAQIKK